MKIYFLQLSKPASFILLLLFSLIGSNGFTQGKLVSGQVTSDQDNMPIVGVNVLIKGTKTGTTTDLDGKFNIELPENNNVLQFSFVGFKTHELTAEPGGNYTVSLKLVEQYLQGVVVTANRSERDMKDVPQKIEIISAQTIDKTIATDMTDLLKKTAGIDVVQYPGMLSGIGIRGFRPQISGLNQKTLLLIDGRPAAATNLSLLDMNNVERVEVLKGPASAVYGAQAMGGVVNIITKKSDGKIGGGAFAGYGSFNTLNAGGFVGGNITKNLDFDASLNYWNQQDDFKLGDDNLFRDAFGWDKATQNFTGNDSTATVDDTRGDGITREKTSFSKISGALRLGYQLNENWRVDIKGDMLTANDVNGPGDIASGNNAPTLKDVGRKSFDGKVSGRINDYNTVSFTGYYGKEDNTNYTIYNTDWTTGEVTFIDPYKSNESEITWNGFQAKNETNLGNHSIVVGYDYNKSEYISRNYNQDGSESAPWSPNYGLETSGVYVQLQLNFLENKLNAVLGGRFESIRYDIYATDLIENRSRKEVNNIFNPSVGLNYKITSKIIAKANYGQGFTPASVFHVAGYSEAPDWSKPGWVNITKGNPALESMKSNTIDLGIGFYDAENSGFSGDVSYFNTKFKNNAIAVYSQPSDLELTASGDTIGSITSYVNAEESNIQGIELNLAYDFGAKSGGNYSLRIFANQVFILESKEIADLYGVGEMEVNMHNVAKATSNFGIEYDNLKKFSIGLTGRYVGNRFDRDWSSYSEFIEMEYPPFLVMDFRARYKITPKHMVDLLVNNITDENYYEKRGFNLMGRNFLVKYNFRF
ncbi:TonB-dependent receptor [Flexithrix dorotheae]|uniref:TonB-dependent receptor n=1 Tax=Flexithrix dorotheae TaxID=70993 RepID=UPI00036C42C6|nr:TonB-dependent receptor [Flexithrix dorotheae]